MKGLVYSIIALMLITPIILLALLYLTTTSTQGNQVVISMRSNEVSYYLDSVSLDFPRALSTSVKQAMVAATSCEDNSGIALANARNSLVSIMMNCSVSQGYDCSFCTSQVLSFVYESSLPRWAQKVQILGQENGFNTSVNVTAVNITQQSPFYLTASANITLSLQDQSGLLNLTRNFTQSIQIPLQGFEDPSYSLYSQGFVKRNYVFTQDYSLSGVSSAVWNKSYYPSSSGPNFLERMEGKLVGSSGNGLESFIYLPDFTGVGLQVNGNNSQLDYLFLNSTGTQPGKQVTSQGFPSWFELDPQTAAKYNLSTS